MKFSSATERLLLTIWVGSLLSVGYLAVPVAFATIGDTVLAGNYAGKLFTIVNYLSIGSAMVLLVTKLSQYGQVRFIKLWRVWVLVIMMGLSLFFLFYLQPQMETIKLQDWHSNLVLVEQFSDLHTFSRNIYLVLTILGIALTVSTDNVKN
jgi:hypothetical protein